ncbi:hypothetical protein A3Q56_03794 [Intoshia linei]|uniref:Uncharacterized protein n=1 Tax=Intoshia linei TaxID=1819745 RepID=A0A177B2D3_9BILA|nr:hypothetical protein A3Q56_03794 [Intoshia linei]
MVPFNNKIDTENTRNVVSKNITDRFLKGYYYFNIVYTVSVSVLSIYLIVNSFQEINGNYEENNNSLQNYQIPIKNNLTDSKKKDIKTTTIGMLNSMIPFNEIAEKLIIKMDFENMTKSEYIYDLKDAITFIKFLNLIIALIVMLYKHIATLSRFSKQILLILLFESLSLLVNSMYSLIVFSPIYTFIMTYFSKNKGNRPILKSEDIPNKIYEQIDLLDFANLEQTEKSVLTAYIITFISVYTVHCIILYYIYHVVLLNLTSNLPITPEISKLLTNDNISSRDRWNQMYAILLKNKIQIDATKKKTKISLTRKNYPTASLLTGQSEDDTSEHNSAKKDKSNSKIHNLIQRGLNSNYIHHTAGTVIMFIFMAFKIYLFNLIYTYENLTDIVSAKMNISDPLIKRALTKGSAFLDVVHVIIVLVVGIILINMKSFNVRIKDKSNKQMNLDIGPELMSKIYKKSDTNTHINFNSKFAKFFKSFIINKTHYDFNSLKNDPTQIFKMFESILSENNIKFKGIIEIFNNMIMDSSNLNNIKNEKSNKYNIQHLDKDNLSILVNILTLTIQNKVKQIEKKKSEKNLKKLKNLNDENNNQYKDFIES